MTQDMKDFFKPLDYEDIEECIELNKRDWGHTLIDLKTLWALELSMIEREILKKKYAFIQTTSRDFLFNLQSFYQDIFNSEMQAQNLKEKIDYVNNKILKEQNDSTLSNIDNNVHDKNK